MSQSQPERIEELDLRTLSVQQINERLRTAEGLEGEGEVEVRITNASGQHGLVSGINQPFHLVISGTVGNCLGMLNPLADIDLTGDAGHLCGHSMSGGSMLIRGHAGQSLGAFAQGGFIGVHGSAKDACGVGLNNADIVVRQTVGARAAMAMRNGNLVLGNDAGHDLGLDATGGTIYLRGSAASVSSSIKEVRMREADAMRLGLLLVRAGIKAATKDFRIYRPRNKSEA